MPPARLLAPALSVVALSVSFVLAGCKKPRSDGGDGGGAAPARGGGAFLMPVEDLFSTGGATVVSGKIRRGEVQSGATVEVVGVRGTRAATVARVEVGGERTTRGRPAGAASLHLSGVARDEVERGDVVSAPGGIAAHRRFKAQISLAAGSAPLRQGYRPQFRVFDVDVTGAVTLPPGTSTIAPGSDAEASVELVHPVACERDLELEMLVGGRAIGRAAITELLD